MAKQITITLPDAYEDATHLVIVAPGEGSGDYQAYATVLTLNDRLPEEIGGGTVIQVLDLAAHKIRHDMEEQS